MRIGTERMFRRERDLLQQGWYRDSNGCHEDLMMGFGQD